MTKVNVVPSAKVKKSFKVWSKKLEKSLNNVSNGKKPEKKFDRINLSDFSEYIYITKLFHNHEYKKAATLICDLDSSLRDEMPDVIFDWVEHLIGY